MPFDATWAVELKGHEFDLQDWQDELKPPFSPHVRLLPKRTPDDRDALVFVSDEFKTCGTPEEVRAIATPLIRRMSGLLAAQRNSKPVTFDTVVKIRSDGAFSRHIFVELEPAEFRIRVHPVTMVAGTDSLGPGDGVVPAPAPSDAQRGLNPASGDLADALEHFDRADNWYDLYKALEAVIKFAGGRENIKVDGLSINMIKDLKETINYYRHHRPKSSPKMDFREARALVGQMINALLARPNNP